jgi:hypothetical protein
MAAPCKESYSTDTKQDFVKMRIWKSPIQIVTKSEFVVQGTISEKFRFKMSTTQPWIWYSWPWHAWIAQILCKLCKTPWKCHYKCPTRSWIVREQSIHSYYKELFERKSNFKCPRQIGHNWSQSKVFIHMTKNCSWESQISKCQWHGHECQHLWFSWRAMCEAAMLR